MQIYLLFDALVVKGVAVGYFSPFSFFLFHSLKYFLLCFCFCFDLQKLPAAETIDYIFEMFLWKVRSFLFTRQISFKF